MKVRIHPLRTEEPEVGRRHGAGMTRGGGRVVKRHAEGREQPFKRDPVPPAVPAGQIDALTFAEEQGLFAGRDEDLRQLVRGAAAAHCRRGRVRRKP